MLAPAIIMCENSALGQQGFRNASSAECSLCQTAAASLWQSDSSSLLALPSITLRRVLGNGHCSVSMCCKFSNSVVYCFLQSPVQGNNSCSKQHSVSVSALQAFRESSSTGKLCNYMEWYQQSHSSPFLAFIIYPLIIGQLSVSEF